VSDGQVCNMRRAAKALADEADTFTSWWEASQAWKGNSREDFTADEMEQWMEAQAQDYADRLSKTFGRKLSDNPELAARALAVHLGRRTADVLHGLRGFVTEDDEVADEDDGDF
jgi:plasmid stabilization system protein ParE